MSVVLPGVWGREAQGRSLSFAEQNLTGHASPVTSARYGRRGEVAKCKAGRLLHTPYYTFILWHQLTGGIRRRWATKPLETFGEVIEAFRTAVEFRFFRWLAAHVDVFAAHKAKFGLIWA